MLLGNESLDLKLTLMDSAQCFHWIETERGYAAAIDGHAVEIWREADGLHAQGDFDRAALRHYLDLERDYAQLAALYGHIPQVRRAVEMYHGLRVLNQPPWEALVSFILSANNNVSRIRNLVRALSRELGTQVSINTASLYAFPAPEALAACSEEKLRSLGVGYRAPYLIQTARQVMEGFPLEKLRDMPYAQAHALLTSLSGVGDKVADCVLLFGCGHSSAFPVDVWVERLMQSWFGAEKCSRRTLAAQARALLGENAGLVQQFLFHAARMGDIEL